jgi:hypothetical protein
MKTIYSFKSTRYSLYVVSPKCIPIIKSCFIYQVCFINVKVIKMIYVCVCDMSTSIVRGLKYKYVYSTPWQSIGMLQITFNRDPVCFANLNCTRVKVTSMFTEKTRFFFF